MAPSNWSWKPLRLCQSPRQPVADMPVIGGYTQYLCVDAQRVVAAPIGLDPAAAVAMILSYTTAYQMLTRLKMWGNE